MPFSAGKNFVFKIDNVAGTLVDITSFLQELDFPREVDTDDVTTAGKNAKVYLPTLSDATISGEGKWDGAASAEDQVLSGILGASVSSTFEYGPGGAGAGAVKYTGECWLTKYEVSGAVGGTMGFSVEFQCTDSVVRTTWP